MVIIQKSFIPLILSYNIRKNKLFYVVPQTKSAQAISSIFIPKIQLGTNWQQSTTKMTLAQLRYDADRFKLFHIIYPVI